MLTTDSNWMREKEKVKHAHQVEKRSGRADDATRPIPERRKNIRNREVVWAWDAGVMPSKSMELMSVRGGNQRFAILARHFNRPTIQIEKPFMKMTELNRVKAVDFFQQPLAN